MGNFQDIFETRKRSFISVLQFEWCTFKEIIRIGLEKHSHYFTGPGLTLWYIVRMSAVWYIFVRAPWCEHLNQLKFAGKLFISESMCHENHQLAYKCRQLKNAGKIHSTWFWNNVINVKLNERSQPAKIYHIIDIEKLLSVGNLDEFINNTSF